MRWVRNCLELVACALVVFSSGACLATTTAPSTQNDFPLTIVGDDGEAVVLLHPPERIIAFDSAAVEILFALGEGDRVIGTHSLVNFPPETVNITKVGDAFNVNLEKSVGLEPDLFFVFFDRFVPDLRKLGIKVLYLKSPETLDDVIERIGLWGRIVSAEEKSDFMSTTLKNRLRSVKKRLPGLKVLHEVGDLWTTGNNTFVGHIYEFLGTENIARGINGWAKISPEVIVEKDPEVIITSYPEGLEVFSQNPAFSNVSAVRQNRVYSVTPDLLSVEGPRIVEAIEELAKLLYPDRFD